MAATSYPFNLIYCEEFRDFIIFLNPKFNIPGLIKINNYANEFSEKMICEIETRLKEANFLTLSTDLWTTKNMKNSFLALNCHFYDKKLNSNQTVLLSLKLMNEKHSAENIKEAIKNIIEKITK